ncbi:hypothetical protein FJ251_11310, partial [bacterium]|nr:hypothetical protein [bacterium]
MHRLLPRFALAALIAAWLLPAAADAAGATRCLTPTLPRPSEPYEAIRARLEAQGRWVASGDPDRSPPPNPQVGDTWLWYIWDLGGFPVANLKPCTVRGMGDHCYVVVDDDEWNVGIDQADVDVIVENFENSSPGNWPTQGIWDLNTGHFGAPPNPLDGLDRVFLLYYRFDISADGFFWVYDQFPDGSQPFASNEADVVYMAVDNGQPAGTYMLAVAAHEFQHLIHYARDTNEDSWLDEGFGELAMWLFGNPDTISSFNTNPDNNLIDFAGNWADYIQTYLWSLYVYEQFGGQPFIWAVAHSSLNGMASYNAVLASQGFGIATDTVFRNWAVANFLDDPSVPNGEFGYLGETLPPFTPWRTVTTYPATGNGGVSAWAGEYMRCTGIGGVLRLEFNGQDIRNFRVAMIGLDDTLPTQVQFLTLNAAQDGSLDFTAAQGYDQVIVMVANVASASGSYTYNLSVLATPAGEGVPAATALAGAQPNPFNPKTSVHFSSDREQRLRLEVLDLAGRRVCVLADETFPAGAHVRDWDGRDAAGRPQPAGLYFARLSGTDGQLGTSRG